MSSPSPPPPEALLEHTAFVRAVARAALGGDALVDDVVQETWLAALQGGASQARKLRPWLGSVAWRRAKDILRRRATEQQRVHQSAREIYSQPTSDVVVRAETGRRLVAAVLALGEPYRTAVLLRYQEGLPPREIARRTGVPVETARTRVKRGLLRLRRALEDDARRNGESLPALLIPLTRPLGVSTAVSSGAQIVGLLAMKKVVTAALLLLFLVMVGVGVHEWTRQPSAPPIAAGNANEAETDHAAELLGPPQAGAPVSEEESTAATGATEETSLVHGVVVDPEGHPIPGVSVCLDQRPPLFGGMAEIVGATAIPQAKPLIETGEDGRFELSAPAGQSWVYLRAAAPGWAMADQVGFGAAVTSEARIVMTPAARLEIRVVDAETRLPVSGAEVQALLGVWAQANLVHPPWPTAFGVTEDNGGATLYVPAGPARLLAWRADYGRTQHELMIESGGHDTITLALQRGGTVRGEVVTARGEPVGGAQVHAFAPAAWQRETTTAPDGTFSLEDTTPPLDGEPDIVERKRVVVLVTTDDHPQAWVDVAAPGPGEEREVRIVLGEGRTLHGRVRTADGSAPAVSGINLTLLEPSYRRSYAGAPSAWARPDERGDFTFPNLPAGPLVLSVRSANGIEREVKVTVPHDREPDPIEVVLGDTVDLAVRVLGASSEPVQDALVYAFPKGGPLPVPYPYRPGSGTDADGRIRLEGQPTVPTCLVVDARGFAPTVVELDPATMGRSEHQVRLSSGRIEGHAVHPDGRPARVSLRLSRLDARVAGGNIPSRTTRVETDESGRFLFTGVGDGLFSIQADAPLQLLSFVGQHWSAGEGAARIVVATPEEAAQLYVEALLLDARSMEPITGQVQVEMHPDGGGGWGLMLPVAGTPGLYRSAQPYPPGDHVVRIGGTGWSAADATVRLRWGDGVPRLRILLEPE